jgi:hypothetical protein
MRSARLSESGQRWQAEGQRLSGAGAGFAQHVSAGESVLDRGRLDWKSAFDPSSFERSNEFVR